MKQSPSDQSLNDQKQRWSGRFAPNVRLTLGKLLVCGVVLLVCSETLLYVFAQDSQPAEDGILAQLREIPAATLADAVDKVTGKRGFMSYDMRPISLKHRMVGRAKTVLYGPAGGSGSKKNLGPLYGVQIIDESGPGDVMVAVTNDLNVTGLGGLMARTASVRGMEGVVVDGAVRDVQEIEEFGMPVFSRSISPATMVGRSTSLARDVPVICGGVTVSPGDYVVGDRDGVVCIPAAQIQPVIKLALKMEATEKKMVPMIYKLKSLQKVVEMFKRI
jgi:regulator of RNase E activity RraA